MDPDDGKNHRQRESVMKRTCDTAFFKAFEGIFQFILKVHIWIRFGNPSKEVNCKKKMLLFHLKQSRDISGPIDAVFGIVSLVASCANAYFSQRDEEFADPDPPLRFKLFAMTSFTICTSVIIFSWSALSSFLRLWIMLPLTSTYAINLSLYAHAFNRFGCSNFFCILFLF